MKDCKILCPAINNLATKVFIASIGNKSPKYRKNEAVLATPDSLKAPRSKRKEVIWEAYRKKIALMGINMNNKKDDDAMKTLFISEYSFFAYSSLNLIPATVEN